MASTVQKEREDNKLLAALEMAETQRVVKCGVCGWEERAAVDKALRIAQTGRWTMMKVYREMQKLGFRGGYEIVRKHAREHLGSQA